MNMLLGLFAAAAAGVAMASAGVHAQTTISYSVIPSYGHPVALMLRDPKNPVYLPATRYKQDGILIEIDYEYVGTQGFGPMAPDFGNLPVTLGELPPGNYTVRARLFDIGQPKAAPQVIEAYVPVTPPDDLGMYTIPAQPQAWGPLQATMKSAVYFDVASMRATVSGTTVRVDFDFYGDAPVGSSPPAGSSSFGSVAVPTLQPGTYTLEGWGRAKATGVVGHYFTKTFTVASSAQVVEFYSPSLDHYFISAGPDEIASIDRGEKGDWQRTGQAFKGWLRASDGPPTAQPVCRFYAKGPNSHFYTAGAGECQMLKDQEASGRATAASQGKEFLGWQYEGIAFYALVPGASGCAPGTLSIYRAYNNGFAQNDSNHRFTVDPALRSAMAVTWSDEGVAMCSMP
jgi:hypothetical protein